MYKLGLQDVLKSNQRSVSTMYSHTIGSAFFAACCLLGLATASSPLHNADGKPDYSFEDLWSLERSFWDTFLYPTNVAQINATDDSVFAENVFPA
jgi:hypothetical protein